MKLMTRCSTFLLLLSVVVIGYASGRVTLRPAQSPRSDGQVPSVDAERHSAHAIPLFPPAMMPDARSHQDALDEISCQRGWGSVDTSQAIHITFAAPLKLALALASGDCPTCLNAEAFRTDSLTLHFRREDGSEADTMDLRIEYFCADTPGDFCSGPGALRCSFETFVAFERDELDTLVYSRRSTFSLGGCLIDSGGAILVIEVLGMRGPGRAPDIYLDNSNTNPVALCSAWMGSSELMEWGDYFPNPDPGYPLASAFITCDLPETVQVASCAPSCEMSRIGGAISSFDTETDAVYQWLGLPQGAVFPMTPTEVRFPIYFPTLGSAQDVAYYTMSLGCLGFGDPCCPPGEELCSQTFSVPRETPFQTIVDVDLNLGALGCCMNEPFWFGLRLDSMSSGAPSPSFLFSTVNQDSAPPQACEQWSGHAGFLRSSREDNLAWADMTLRAACGSCLTGNPVICGTVNYGSLECGSALSLACVDSGWTLQNQLIPSGLGLARRYCCSDIDMPGAEAIYRIEVPNGGTLSLAMLDVSGAPLRMMILETCDLHDCIASTTDSLLLGDLRNGTYYIVVDSPTETGAVFDLYAECFSQCLAVACDADVRGAGGVGNRYYDGEGDDTGDAFFYSYYSGSGTQQTILRFDATTCAELTPVVWNSAEASASRMLAFDPRDGGKFWCGTVTDYFAGTGKLYRVNMQGAVEQSWNALGGLPILRWSGAAFDPNHNHLWVMIRDSANFGNSRAYEIDVNNMSSPVVIQGPHLIQNQSPHTAISSGGADYARLVNHLVVAHQGLPSDFVQCYEDVNPAYAGPRPGPGLVPLAWCAPDSNGVQGFGLALVEDSLEAREEMLMTNFTDSDWQHPMNRYVPPCRLTPPRCEAPQDVTIVASSGDIVLHWTTPYSGTYDLYSTTNPDHDGNPDGGADPDFHIEQTFSLVSGLHQWTDAGAAEIFKVYVIAAVCSANVAQGQHNNR
jgi:hypothetical protein